MPGGNELADPAPGDFNAAPWDGRAGRSPGWAEVGLGGAGMHCAPELLRDQQHRRARGRVNPLLIKNHPRRARGPRVRLFRRLAYIGATFSGVGACDNPGAVQRAALPSGEPKGKTKNNTNPSVTPDLIRGDAWFGRCRRGGGADLGGLHLSPQSLTAIPHRNPDEYAAVSEATNVGPVLVVPTFCVLADLAGVCR